MKRDGIIIATNLWGNARSPNKKKIRICARLVSPSKKGIIIFLFLILLFPNIIPKRYTVKKAFPSMAVETPKEKIIRAVSYTHLDVYKRQG